MGFFIWIAVLVTLTVAAAIAHTTRIFSRKSSDSSYNNATRVLSDAANAAAGVAGADAASVAAAVVAKAGDLQAAKKGRGGVKRMSYWLSVPLWISVALLWIITFTYPVIERHYGFKFFQPNGYPLFVNAKVELDSNAEVVNNRPKSVSYKPFRGNLICKAWPEMGMVVCSHRVDRFVRYVTFIHPPLLKKNAKLTVKFRLAQ